MDQLILNWLQDNRDYALWLVPSLAFLEAITGLGIFVSGVILLSVCTLLYMEGIATLVQMLPLAFLGAAVSDHAGYYLGRWIGPRFHQSPLAQKRVKAIARAESMFQRFGALAIVIGRLVTAIRSFVPLLAGITGVTRLHFTMFDLLACAIWTTGLGLLVVGLDQVF